VHTDINEAMLRVGRTACSTKAWSCDDDLRREKLPFATDEFDLVSVAFACAT